MRSWYDDNLAILRRTQPQAAAILSQIALEGEGSDHFGQNKRDGANRNDEANGKEGLKSSLSGDWNPPRDFSPEDSSHEDSSQKNSGPEVAAQKSLVFGFNGSRALLEPGPKDFPALTLEVAGGRKRLSSAIAPEGEDKSLVDRYLAEDPRLEGGLTIFGLGLGYHAEYLAEKLPPEAPLWLLEGRPELAAAAMAARDLSELLSRPGLVLRLGPARNLPTGAPKTVLARPANLRIDSDLYPSVSGLEGFSGEKAAIASGEEAREIIPKATSQVARYGDTEASARPIGHEEPESLGHSDEAFETDALSRRAISPETTLFRGSKPELKIGSFPKPLRFSESDLPSSPQSSARFPHQESNQDLRLDSPQVSRLGGLFAVQASSRRDYLGASIAASLGASRTESKAPPARPVYSAAKDAAPRILFLDAGYFLSREITLAAGALGSEVETWKIPSSMIAEEEDYKRLLSTIKTFRPALILTVNHLGFDSEGLLASILRRLGLPAASWFVDSPAIILGGADLGPRSDVHVFSWDEDYLGLLSDFGFASPAFLPLASSEAYFRAPSKPPKIKRDMAFVGDSLKAATEKYLSLAGLESEMLPILDLLAERFVEGSSPTPAAEAEEIVSRLSLGPTETAALEALITWRGSRLSRLRILRALPGDKLSIAGDKGWEGLIPGAKLLGGIEYYKGLRAFYQSSAVNLNITSAQMRNGLNQRVFDVPASKAFLLTDKKSQLDALYEPGEEVAVYSGPAEAEEKALWYLKHPGEREKIAEKAWRRTLSEHLYRHRLKKLLDHIGIQPSRKWPR